MWNGKQTIEICYWPSPIESRNNVLMRSMTNKSICTKGLRSKTSLNFVQTICNRGKHFYNKTNEKVKPR